MATTVTLEAVESYLCRLDILIHRQILRMQQGRVPGPAAENIFAALSFSPEQAYELLQRPFGVGDPTVATEATVTDAEYEASLAVVDGQIAAQARAAEAEGKLLPLPYLAAVFDLEPFALDVLLICLAPELDLRYQKLYGYLMDDLARKRPTVNMILDLLCPPGPQRLLSLRWFDSQSPLLRLQLIHPVADPGTPLPPLLNQSFAPDPVLVAWLLGYYQAPAELRSMVAYTAQPAADGALLAPAQQAVIRDAPSQSALVVLYGRDSLVQESIAYRLAEQLEQSLLTLDMAQVVRAELSPLRAVELVLRDALLIYATVYIRGWEACFADGVPPAALVTALCAHPGPVVIAAERRWRTQHVARSRPFFWLECPLPDHTQRQQLLTHFLAGAITVPDLQIAAVTNQFVLSTAQLRDVASSAVDVALQAGRPVSDEDLFAAAREHSNPNLGALARKLRRRYDWDDLILPAAQKQQLHEFVGRVAQRPLVLKRWGAGEKLAPSEGATVLFAGPPGTGKTMAAEVMARTLGLDIYKIDLSSMVSKYIGETEKNLERIFSEAESSSAILFFDEADAIFGKRSEVKDAHDRYANIEVSYLLQRMEMYDGVTILATNLQSNLDDAFARRFDAKVDFPFPEEAERLRIWQTLFPAGLPRAADIDFAYLARTFKLAGGNIRNIIMGAAFLAAADGQVVTMAHLLHSTRRELQKMGRLVNDRDFVYTTRQ